MRRAVDIADGLDVEELMHAAIDATASTYPHPNPRVGCIIVTPNHDVLSVGVCHGDGLPHAEANALASLADTDLARGATAVVTLEPCSHHGRTPPCADALVDAGVERVVIGAQDPDPKVSGNGIRKLTDAGIDVIVGVAADAVVAADPAYFHHRTTGLPRVTLKMATTLDGQAAAIDGTSQWITDEAARTDVHHLRSQNDVVLTGSGTVLADDPTLTVRYASFAGPQPRPVVVVGNRSLPADAHVMLRDPIVYGADSPGHVEVEAVIKDLGSRGVLSVLVEAGPTLSRAFLDAHAVDQVVWYLGAKLAGGAGRSAIGGTFNTLGDAVDLTVSDVTRFGSSLRITATPKWGSS